MKHKHLFEEGSVGKDGMVLYCDCGFKKSFNETLYTKPMKRIKKEVEKKKHIHKYNQYWRDGASAIQSFCECGELEPKVCSPKPTKIKKVEEIKTNPINEHTDINIVVIVNKLNEVVRAVNNLLSH